jgi:CheY-like chemotaxis protein
LAVARPSVARPAASATGGSGDILLVEDNRQVGEATAAMLEDIGHRVQRVEDPKAALAILEKSRGFELVLADIVMPDGMSGADLAREIRRRFPAMRVVLTTGYSKAAAEIAGEGVAVLRKPYRVSDLADAIGSVLSAC